MSTIALYIHWPFCKSKCPYCDFNSHVREGIDYQAWEQAYLRELEYFSPVIRERKVQSVFFGGGTPSLMPPGIAAAILEKLASLCQLDADTEITLEANPTSVEADKFHHFRAAGINRVSLGVQSLRAVDLAFLGREHNAEEAIQAITLARDIFPRYSFDLIYARPKQTLTAWEEELGQALSLCGDHLSLYQLTIEKGTAFYSRHKQGDFHMPDEELAAEFFELTQRLMQAAGMPAYEVSNHAKPGGECQHNLVYWRYQDYLGIGPGAHSRLQIEGKKHALMMLHSPEGWLKSVYASGHGIQQQAPLTPTETLEEMLLMGLRLQEGIPRQRFVEYAGCEPEKALRSDKLQLLIDHHCLVLDNTRLYATRKGMLILNSVVKEIL